MNFHLDVPTYKCLFLITAIHIFIYSVQSLRSRYILPILPDTNYSLNDVIILPENSDVVEIALVSTNTSIELASLNLTNEHEFRLGRGIALQNISIESGLQFTTSCNTTVVIDLPGGVLKLSSFSDCGHLYHLPTLPGKSDFVDKSWPLVLLSQVPDTFITVCGINNEDKIITRNSKQTLKIEDNTNNCSIYRISSNGVHFLNDTLGFTSIKIESEHRICILQGHLKLSPESVRLTHWQTVQTLSKRTNNFILLPSNVMRVYTFRIFSPVDNIVDLKSEANLTTINLTEDIPITKSITIPANNVLTFTGTDEYFFNCMKSDKTPCNDEIFPVNVKRFVGNYSSDSDVKPEEHMWAYITKSITLFILCPYDANLIVKNSSGPINEEAIVDFYISNTFLILKSLANFPEGLYKISSRERLHSDLLFYLPIKSMNEFKNVHYFNSSAFKTTPSIIFAKTLNYKSIDSSNSNLTSEKYSTILLNETVNESITSVKETTENNSVSLMPLNEHSVETTASFVDESTQSSILYEKLTQTVNDVSDTVGNKNTEGKIDKLDPNRRFKAVVNILHSDEGRKDILIDKSNTHVDPKYTYKYIINSKYGQEGDGKNPVAIIASLVSAILSVGAIILIYLLKDFFSRRQNIRKTRIRPFISDY